MWISQIRLLFFKTPLFLSLLIVLGSAVSAPGPDEIANLGRALFFDSNLSATRNQSCASCHDPGQAFSDSRDNGIAGAVSLGDDGSSLGDRNTPGTTYASLIPDFHKNDKDEYIGGYFLDGRAATITDQAAEPSSIQLKWPCPIPPPWSIGYEKIRIT